MKKIILFTVFAIIAGLVAACSNTTETNTPPKSEEVTPASVKAALPDATAFTKQHKDIPADAIANIEKDTGGKVPDTDHHSYLAFSTTGGSRKQIGAVTVVKVDGKELVVVYDSKDGSPIIKEIRGEGVSADFLKQFAGKGHDDKLEIGADLKADGLDETQAKTIAVAVKIDVITMQTLYGASHSH